MTARATIELICDDGMVWHEKETGRVFTLADDDTSEALRRESMAVGVLNREVDRLKAENERVKKLLDTVFAEYCGAVPCELASKVIKALGADDE